MVIARRWYSSFKQLGIAEDVCQNLATAFKITEPTTGQRQFLPHIVAGRDMLLKDRTGSGKTFGLTVALASLKKPALYIVPNQELAAQVQGWLGQLSLRSNVVVGTPGRLLQQHETAALPMFKRIIIDEVDQALKLPKRYAPLRDRFRRERHPKPTQVLIQALLQRTATKPQMIVASATLNRPLRLWLAHQQWVHDPALVSLHTDSEVASNVTHHCLLISDDTIRNIRPKSDTEASSPAESYDSTMARVSIDFDDADERMVESIAILQDLEDVRRGILFVDPSISTSAMQKRLAEHGVIARDIAEYDPCQAWDGQPELWISTEFSARGMDIPGVSHIFLLGRPVSIASYLHMAGRTGRLRPEGHSSQGKVICVMRDKGRAESRMHAMYNFMNVTPEPYEHVQA